MDIGAHLTVDPGVIGSVGTSLSSMAVGAAKARGNFMVSSVSFVTGVSQQ